MPETSASDLRVPRDWGEVFELAREAEIKPPHMQEIEMMSKATKDTVMRIFYGNHTPVIPGAAQTEEYAKHVLMYLGINETLKRQADQRIALQMGLWQQYLQKAKLEMVLHPEVLRWKPPTMGRMAMREAMTNTLELSDHPNVDMWVLGNEAVETNTVPIFYITYPDGVHGAPSRGALDMAGFGVLGTDPIGTGELEKKWEEERDLSYSIETSRHKISQAIEAF